MKKFDMVVHQSKNHFLIVFFDSNQDYTWIK